MKNLINKLKKITMTITLKTETQIQRAASAKIKAYVKAQSNKTLQYYFVRGMFHINNIDEFTTAKTICEDATNLPFKHFSNSICKLDFDKINNQQ